MTMAPPRLRIGNTEIRGISDGVLKTSVDVIVGMERTESTNLLATADGSVLIPVNNFLIQRAGKTVLIDAGAGNTMQATLGKLPGNLRAVGVEPGAVTHIVMTHLHPDHANGLVDDAGQPHYPNAEIVVHQAELDFWTAPERSGDHDLIKRNRARTKINLAPYHDRLRSVRSGEDYLGFTPVLAPGHTPGHTCWLAVSSGGSFMVFGDVVHFSAIQIAHPDAAVTYDLDREQAVASRKRILDMAAFERIAIAGAHVDAPGFGYIVRKGARFAFEPAAS